VIKISVEAVLFDVHGTLIDKGGEEALRAAVKSVVSFLQNCGTGIDDEGYFAIWQENLKRWALHLQGNREVDFYLWYEFILCKIGLEPNLKIIDELNSHWMMGFEKYTRSYEGSERLLVALRQRGYKLGVVSNGFARNTVLDLERTGLFRYFDAVVVSSDVGFRKPEPVVFRKALEKLAVHPGNAVMVGDNEAEDISGAKELGLSTVLIRNKDGLREVTNKILEVYLPANVVKADIQASGPEELLVLVEDGKWPN
jgi:putative hydrolase of the HAD superfamily